MFKVRAVIAHREVYMSQSVEGREKGESQEPKPSVAHRGGDAWRGSAGIYMGTAAGRSVLPRIEIRSSSFLTSEWDSSECSVMPAVKALVVISPVQSGFSSPGSLSRTVSLPHSDSQIQQTELPWLCMYGLMESPLPSPKHYCALPSTPSGFPDGSDGKESAHNAGDPGLIPGSGRSPGGRNGYLL